MVKTSVCKKTGVKRGAWTQEEDKLLAAYITRYGHWNWHELPKFAGLSRCGKSCRLRWLNYLKPNIKRGNFTKDEEQIIIDMHKLHGNRWSKIASHLEGRTDNEIKNYWHTHLKKNNKDNYISNVKRRKCIGKEIPKGKISLDSVMILESSSIPVSSPQCSESSGFQTSSDSSSSTDDESKSVSRTPEKTERGTVIQINDGWDNGWLSVDMDIPDGPLFPIPPFEGQKTERETVIQNNDGWDNGWLSVDMDIPDGPLFPIPPFEGQSFPWDFDNEYEMEGFFCEFLFFTSSCHI